MFHTYLSSPDQENVYLYFYIWLSVAWLLVFQQPSFNGQHEPETKDLGLASLTSQLSFSLEEARGREKYVWTLWPAFCELLH